MTQIVYRTHSKKNGNRNAGLEVKISKERRQRPEAPFGAEGELHACRELVMHRKSVRKNKSIKSRLRGRETRLSVAETGSVKVVVVVSEA